MKYGIRQHRGTLKDSLQTKKYISKDDFIRVKDQYKFYTFDSRCNQRLYIAKDFEHSLYSWLFIEFTNQEIEKDLHITYKI